MHKCRMTQPLLIGGLLAYFNPDKSDHTDISTAYFYASALVLNILVTVIMYHTTQFEILHVGMKMRIACCSAIYKKVYTYNKNRRITFKISYESIILYFFKLYSTFLKISNIKLFFIVHKSVIIITIITTLIILPDHKYIYNVK